MGDLWGKITGFYKVITHACNLVIHVLQYRYQYEKGLHYVTPPFHFYFFSKNCLTVCLSIDKVNLLLSELYKEDAFLPLGNKILSNLFFVIK